jgi:ribosomal protein S1
MANHYVSNPIEVVSVGQKVSVRVLDIDEEREKVSLTMKDQSSMESKVERDFKKNKKEDVSPSRDENDTSSSLKSNITFTKI